MVKKASNIRGNIQAVSFSLGRELYGVDVMICREVISLEKISRIPNTQSYMKGLIDLRGEIIPVVDMRSKLGFEEKTYDENTVILISDIAGNLIGLIVDTVADVMTINADDIQLPAHFTLNIDHDIVSGVVKTGDCLLQILDLSKLFTQEEMNGLRDSVNAEH